MFLWETFLTNILTVQFGGHVLVLGVYKGLVYRPPSSPSHVGQIRPCLSYQNDNLD